MCLRVFAFLRPLFQARLPAGFITVFLLRRRAQTDRTASRSVLRLLSGFLLLASLTARDFTRFSQHFVLALSELARFASSAHRCALIAASNRLFRPGSAVAVRFFCLRFLRGIVSGQVVRVDGRLLASHTASYVFAPTCVSPTRWCERVGR